MNCRSELFQSLNQHSQLCVRQWLSASDKEQDLFRISFHYNLACTCLFNRSYQHRVVSIDTSISKKARAMSVRSKLDSTAHDIYHRFQLVILITSSNFQQQQTLITRSLNI